MKIENTKAEIKKRVLKLIPSEDLMLKTGISERKFSKKELEALLRTVKKLDLMRKERQKIERYEKQVTLGIFPSRP